jgi:hypothetical protein
MWLFNAAPKEKVKAKYGFDLTQEWLDHVRLSSVRFNNGGSGSFVSADGLTFTNHHIGSTCIQQLSSEGRDYMANGFHARTRAEEAKCPDLELNVLKEIEDVTEKVNASVQPGMSTAQAGQAQRASMSRLESECVKRGHDRCDVVTLYAGSMYHLYKYKKYTDVRLVFAPEQEIAFFGGDPDNFTYPRYDLDVAFFRIYENDQPAKLQEYLKWSREGAKEGQLVFISGNPGNTSRLKTVSQLAYLRDVAYPFQLQSLARRVSMLKEFSKRSAEHERIANEDIFSFENSIKSLTGSLKGLQDPELMGKKRAEERRLRELAEDPKRRERFAKVFDEIERAMIVQREIFKPLTFLERRAALRGDLAWKARALVRAVVEKQKPNEERLREYRDSALPSLEQQLFSTAPIYKELEQALLALSLREMMEELGGNAPPVQKVLRGRTPEEAAKQIISETQLEKIEMRRKLYESGPEGIEASDDPLIVAMRAVEPEARAVRKRYDDEVEAVERRNGALLAQLRFEQAGTSMYPDATFTLRLGYGVVKGYSEGGKNLQYFTTLGGTYDHAARHANKPPWKLPTSWVNGKSKLNLKTPFNFVSTPDIIGGNSGSPVVNTKGEIVGIIFDGNLASLPWDFQYDDKQGRAISVDSRGIVEAMRKIYGATAVVDELMGTEPKKAGAGE